jgi:hypothetical protein
MATRSWRSFATSSAARRCWHRPGPAGPNPRGFEQAAPAGVPSFGCETSLAQDCPGARGTGGDAPRPVSRGLGTYPPAGANAIATHIDATAAMAATVATTKLATVNQYTRRARAWLSAASV